MSFSNPEAFILLALLALFILTAIYNYRKKNKLLNAFLSTTAYKRLGVRSGKEIDFFKTALIALALFFLIIALAGPEWGEKFENLDVKGLEMVFLMDTSVSMKAEDLLPSRLAVAKQLVGNVVDALDTDYVSLINFAGFAYIQCPLTIDYDAFKLLTQASIISPSEEQGTDFQRALELGLKTFEKSKSENKVMILITDGEDQERTWTNAIDQLKEQKVIIFTVGVGHPDGVPIPIRDSNGKVTGWKKDKKGETVKTRLDENTLIQIASNTGGQYFSLTDVSAIDTLVDNLKDFERDLLKKKVRRSKIKRYHYPLIIAFILLVVELLLSEKRLLMRRKKEANK